MAQSQLAGATPLYFGIAPDNENDTFELLNQAVLQSDLVLLSGGISAGDFDFVPEVILKAGFEILFRSMAVQPGKPLIFAVRDKKYIVALPGNPVSSYVQFEMLVTHLIRKITGNLSPLRETTMPFGVEYVRKKASRKAFIPVLIGEDGMVYPVDYHGSAHMHAYVSAQAIASISEGCFSISKGTLVNVRFI
jgi:molybdopterin molybdotransferase